MQKTVYLRFLVPYLLFDMLVYNYISSFNKAKL